MNVKIAAAMAAGKLMAKQAAFLRKFKGFMKSIPAQEHVYGIGETAGLGILAKPSIDVLRNKNSTPKERREAKYELAGLGVLEGTTLSPYIHEAIKRLRK